VNGLDIHDLRDWAGSSNARGPHTPIPDKNEEAPYGWHWGNRGGVASAAIEKPHLSGWRPILQGEFELAYSPLMELDLGAGRVTLCMLDLEERFNANAPAMEPAVQRLAAQMVRYAQTAPLSPRVAQVALIGTAPKWLDMLGVRYENATSLPATAGVVLIASDVNVDEGALNSYLQNGGKAVFLPRQTANAPLGVTLAQKVSTGSLEAPNWNVAGPFLFRFALAQRSQRVVGSQWRRANCCRWPTGGEASRQGHGGVAATRSRALQRRRENLFPLHSLASDARHRAGAVEPRRSLA
jgi:beta-galactosidase